MLLNMKLPSLKIISVRDACNAALPGLKKNEAMKHYAAAEEARGAMKEAESNRELDAATQALL
ncbi:MAG: hypothetical protein FKY71_11505 [Spiribacter salinus]|uniref:Uncharacterized protein n=1 Tax=Spiribacter salinus TaxID=1335746 RepID=A0A540VQ32_9GAMM|nr:MAG: hypothetical protein FKY71_11505 [Spiribacter salinus]